MHVNTTEPLRKYLENRYKATLKATDGNAVVVGNNSGVVFLKRLNIVLNDESEKGFGLVSYPDFITRMQIVIVEQTAQNTSMLNGYDLLSLTPTTPATLSLACLTHTLPSPLTTHIISLPLPSSGSSSASASSSVSRIKHTLVRTTKRNGAVFEVVYVGALGGEGSDALNETGGEAASSTNISANARSEVKRMWWAAAREIVRVAKGTGVIVSGGAAETMDLRAPRDVGNL